jgi:glycosyl transferase family 11
MFGGGNDMIVVKLIGGLGNQMFQYAAGRALALRHDVPLAIDISWFGGSQRGKPFAEHRRQYALGDFRINASILPEISARRYFRGKLMKRALRRLSLGFLDRLIPGPQIYIETHADYDPELSGRKPPLYLDGYFQSWRYFDAIEEILRSEFRLRDSTISTRALMLAQAARGIGPLIGLHVRRGDYVHPAIKGIHFPPSEQYLLRAMATFGPLATFLVVSDDLPWCREVLSGPKVVIADAGDMIRDLFALAACDGYILSASSFSWWGAWLGDPSRTKQVVAPGRWFGGGRATAGTGDVVLPHWRQM